MNERTQLILKLILSHFVLPVLIISASFLLRNDGYLSIGISQTIIVIIILSGYWEFFTSKFKYAYFIIYEALILTSAIIRATSEQLSASNAYVIIILSLFQIFLFYQLLKIVIVIFKKEKDSIEIEFPFKNGKYRITDGGNSRISRLMNYHFHSPVHKKRNTNKSMIFAVDVVEQDEVSKRFLPLSNSDYPIFNKSLQPNRWNSI